MDFGDILNYLVDVYFQFSEVDQCWFIEFILCLFCVVDNILIVYKYSIFLIFKFWCLYCFGISNMMLVLGYDVDIKNFVLSFFSKLILL